MAKYEAGVTPFAMPHWDVGHLSARPYLLCLDCGELWVQVAGRMHELKKDHNGSCPAEDGATALHGYASPAVYSYFMGAGGVADALH